MKTIIVSFMLISFMCVGDTRSAFAESKRSTSINFEDELIEGINRKPLDSFNQISEQNRKKKNHLYNKRRGFHDRDQVLFSEMELTP